MTPIRPSSSDKAARMKQIDFKYTLGVVIPINRKEKQIYLA